MVRDNAQQMGVWSMIILTFSRLGRSALKTARSPDDLMRQALTELREQENRHVEISSSELPVCEADPALLKQVWINLFNASNYSPTGDRPNPGRLSTNRWKPVYFVKRQWCALYDMPTNSSAYSSVCTVLSMRNRCGSGYCAAHHSPP